MRPELSQSDSLDQAGTWPVIGAQLCSFLCILSSAALVLHGQSSVDVMEIMWLTP